jgi:hypothetical protein
MWFAVVKMSMMQTSKTFEESTLKDEVDRHWKEIVKLSYQFDKQPEEVCHV